MDKQTLIETKKASTVALVNTSYNPKEINSNGT